LALKSNDGWSKAPPIPPKISAQSDLRFQKTPTFKHFRLYFSAVGDSEEKSVDQELSKDFKT